MSSLSVFLAQLEMWSVHSVQTWTLAKLVKYKLDKLRKRESRGGPDADGKQSEKVCLEWEGSATILKTQCGDEQAGHK